MCPTGSALQNNTKNNQNPNLRSAFEVLDVDGDGKISYEDLRALYGGFSGPGGSDDDVIGSMIALADSNKNGYVEYEEFERVLNGRKKGKDGRAGGGAMEDAFRAMDKDGDGRVGHEDLKSCLDWAGFEAHDEDVKAMITLGGGDENGGVTFEVKMKENQLQTPQRDQTSAIRRSKSTSDLNKNPRKVSKKKLSPAFKAVSEDDSDVLESLKEFPEVSDDNNPFVESAENFIALADPLDTPSSETVAISDLTSPTLSSFSVLTSDDHLVVNATETNFKIPEADFFDEIKSIETEVVIKHLREARIQVMKSKDMGSSKKILDALINIVIEEFDGGVFKEKKRVDKFLSKKANVVFLSLMMGIYAILMVLWFISSDAKEFQYIGPTPT